MKSKRLLITLFLIVVVAQLFVPYQMISKQADYALTGKEFRFRIRHIHRGEAEGYSGNSMQGKYIWLQLEQDKYMVTNKMEWDLNQTVYVSFLTDDSGYAGISSVAKTKPAGSDWVKARAFLNYKDSSSLKINYPFSNYYIEDQDTRDIDAAFTRKLRDSTSTLCLKVNIKENQFIVRDLTIDSLTFKDFVKKIRSRRSS